MVQEISILPISTLVCGSLERFSRAPKQNFKKKNGGPTSDSCLFQHITVLVVKGFSRVLPSFQSTNRPYINNKNGYNVNKVNRWAVPSHNVAILHNITWLYCLSVRPVPLFQRSDVSLKQRLHECRLWTYDPFLFPRWLVGQNPEGVMLFWRWHRGHSGFRWVQTRICASWLMQSRTATVVAQSLVRHRTVRRDAEL